MKIHFSKKQYWDLLRAVYIADWVANAICEEDMKEDAGIKAIRDYIFSFAKEMGYEKFVQHDKELGRYFATFDLDDEPQVRDLIDRFEEDALWDELIDRLGMRDFFRKYSEKEIEAMGEMESVTNLSICEDAWADEFETHGLSRLKIGAQKETDAVVHKEK